jgi:UrcA family protein
MKYANAIAMDGAAVICAAAIALTITPADGRTLQPVVVTAEDNDLVVREVKFADLNLASMNDQRVLQLRVTSAVRDACGEAVGHDDEWNYRYCYVGAWQDARPQIARAVNRARQIALSGTSTITAAAVITFSVHN